MLINQAPVYVVMLAQVFENFNVWPLNFSDMTWSEKSVLPLRDTWIDCERSKQTGAALVPDRPETKESIVGWNPIKPLVDLLTGSWRSVRPLQLQVFKYEFLSHLLLPHMAPDFKALRNQLNLCCPEDQTKQANLEVFIAKSLKLIRRPEADGQGFYRIHVALTPPCGENLTHIYAWLLMEYCFICQQTSSAPSICTRVH